MVFEQHKSIDLDPSQVDGSSLLRKRHAAISFATSLFVFTSIPLVIAWGFSSSARLFEPAAGASSAEVVSITSTSNIGLDDGVEVEQELVPVEVAAESEAVTSGSKMSVELEPNKSATILKRPDSAEVTQIPTLVETGELVELDVVGESPVVTVKPADQVDPASSSESVSNKEVTESRSLKVERDPDLVEKQVSRIPRASVASIAFSSARAIGVDNDQMPVASTQSVPEYPPVLLSKGIEGVVLLKIEISSAGVVTDCQVKQSSGYPEMDESAMKAVNTWRFEPAKLLGQPVASMVLKKIRFKIVAQQTNPAADTPVGE